MHAILPTALVALAQWPFPRRAPAAPDLPHSTFAAPQVVEALFKLSSGNGDFGSPPRMPAQLSRLCVADPERAGTGNCKKASRGGGSPVAAAPTRCGQLLGAPLCAIRQRAASRTAQLKPGSHGSAPCLFASAPCHCRSKRTTIEFTSRVSTSGRARGATT